MNIIMLPLSQLKRDKNQPRQSFDENKIKEMAQSIVTEGIINPIEVDEDYVIVTGEVRSRAAKLAGLKEVPCKIIKVDPKLRFRRQVIENIHNLTMTPYDTAKALVKLLPTPGVGKGHWNDKGLSKLAKEVGMADQTLRDYIAILKATQPIQIAIKENRINFSSLRILASTPEKFKKKMEDRILKENFTNRDEAQMFVEALKRYPEKAEEILKAKDVQEVNKIAPPVSHEIRKSFEPTEELSGINRQLQEWANKYPPDKLGGLQGRRVLLTFTAMQEVINLWLKIMEQKQLN